MDNILRMVNIFTAYYAEIIIIIHRTGIDKGASAYFGYAISETAIADCADIASSSKVIGSP